MPHLTPARVCASADESYISDCTVLRCCTTSTIRYNRRNRTSLLMVSASIAGTRVSGSQAGAGYCAGLSTARVPYEYNIQYEYE